MDFIKQFDKKFEVIDQCEEYLKSMKSDDKQLSFEEFFTDKQKVITFLEKYLSEERKSKINFKQFELYENIKKKSTGQEDMYHKVREGIVYKTYIPEKNQSVYIFIKLQKQNDQKMPLHFEIHNMDIMFKHLKKYETEKIPEVMNISIYQGKEKYNSPRSLKEMYIQGNIDRHNIKDNVIQHYVDITHKNPSYYVVL